MRPPSSRLERTVAATTRHTRGDSQDLRSYAPKSRSWRSRVVMISIVCEHAAIATVLEAEQTRAARQANESPARATRRAPTLGRSRNGRDKALRGRGVRRTCRNPTVTRVPRSDPVDNRWTYLRRCNLDGAQSQNAVEDYRQDIGHLVPSTRPAVSSTFRQIGGLFWACTIPDPYALRRWILDGNVSLVCFHA